MRNKKVAVYVEFISTPIILSRFIGTNAETAILLFPIIVIVVDFEEILPY